MGRGNTDRHAHTNRQMNTHEPNTVGRSEKHTKTDEYAHLSAKKQLINISICFYRSFKGKTAVPPEGRHD